jgi:tellurium resistance protein TerZ
MDKLKTNDEVFDLISEDGSLAKNICFGANWDSIEKDGVLGARKIKVDMDISCVVFDEYDHILDVIYYYQMKSKDGSIIHTGDNSYSHRDDENLDNEVIVLNLDNIEEDAKRLIFILNSYDQVEFASIPHIKIRVYEGKPNRPNEIYAYSDINNENLLDGYQAMLIAELYRHDDRWTFSAIFELTEDKDLEDSITNLKKRLHNDLDVEDEE